MSKIYSEDDVYDVNRYQVVKAVTELSANAKKLVDATEAMKKVSFLENLISSRNHRHDNRKTKYLRVCYQINRLSVKLAYNYLVLQTWQEMENFNLNV